MRVSPRLLAALVVALALVGLRPAAAADDPLVNRQWGLTQIHAASAWSVSTGKDVKIGIVDSGVNRNHEDLAGKVIASATCVSTAGDPAKCSAGAGDGDDINGHGTHVAGIAAGNTGNGIGIASVAPGAKLIVARVFSPDPNGGEPTADLQDVKAGIEWVVSQGAQIVNLSVGVDTQSATCTLLGGCANPLGPAVEEAWTRGALPIIASGNSNAQLFGGGPGYGNLDAIVVGATGMDGNVAAYSSAIGSAKWGIVAPGGDAVATNDSRCDSSHTDCPMVLSTYAATTGTTRCDDPNRCYAYLAGTSMATPHVSGAAALLFAKGLTRQEVVDTLLATADTVSCGSTCAGRLNAARAVGTVGGPATTAGNNGGHTATTTRKLSTSTSRAATTTTPTTSPFAFNTERPPDPSTTLRPKPHAAIVLNTPPPADKGVPVGVGLAGIVSLAAAALAMSYNLRRTLTTLP